MQTNPQLESPSESSLAVKKLALEVAELERPWWKRPTYILAALPTLLAIAALSVGFLNGFFDAQLTKLENQRHDLRVEVKEFEAKRDALSTENEKLIQENKNIKDELEGRTQEARNRQLAAAHDAMERAKCEGELRDLKGGRK